FVRSLPQIDVIMISPRYRVFSGRSVFGEPSFGARLALERAADGDVVRHLDDMPLALDLRHRKLGAGVGQDVLDRYRQREVVLIRLRLPAGPTALALALQPAQLNSFADGTLDGLLSGIVVIEAGKDGNASVGRKAVAGLEVVVESNLDEDGALGAAEA